MTSDIFLIERDFKAKYRRTIQSDQFGNGWTERLDGSEPEVFVPRRGPRPYATDVDDPARAAAIEPDAIAERERRAFQVPQHLDDILDAFEPEFGEFFAKPSILDLVEEMDPGIHDLYRDILIRSGPVQAFADIRYGTVHVRPLIKCVDLEKSKVEKTDWSSRIKVWPNGKAYRWTLTALTPEARVILRSALDAGFALWQDDETRELFCTKKFKDRVQAVGANGLEFEPCTVMDGASRLRKLRIFGAKPLLQADSKQQKLLGVI